MIFCPPSVYLMLIRGRRCFRSLTLVQQSSGKYLTCLSFLFDSLNVPASWSGTLTHCIHLLSLSMFLVLQTILPNSSFVSHHVSKYHSWLLSCNNANPHLDPFQSFFPLFSLLVQTTSLSYSTDKRSAASEQSSVSYNSLSQRGG